MTAGASRVRIRGLVKVMRWARTKLSTGIPAEKAEDFRTEVLGVLKKVESICRRSGITPQDLPAPSYRAYCYLRDIDLHHLPLVAATDAAPDDRPAPAKHLRIRGLVAAQQRLDADFVRWVEDHHDQVKTLDAEGEPVAGWLSQIYATLDFVNDAAAEAQAPVSLLPARSRRAYQWLSFLSDPANLLAHVKTAAALQRIARRPPCRSAIPKSRRSLPARISFAYSSSLFHARVQEGVLAITVHEGFVGAPQDVLQALLCAALAGDQQAFFEPALVYSQSDAFQEATEALEVTIVDGEVRARGQYFDLDAVFERVNAAYFAGALARPRLTWNQILTHRKLGHYHPATDTLMISITLDAPGVPDYVIDYVMYHELLHKQLGVKLVNGRRRAHTADFRKAERAFPDYEKAEAFLREALK
ncbi:MAG: M48 family metallopeptidase [Anaerolineae bacterium]|nr:M48 family metallopeptidase [Anaerolineae bacterium]